MQFAEVILPLPLEGTFSYSIPESLQPLVKVGQRVAVPFGKRKLYTGIVHSLHNNSPILYKTKPLHALLDRVPLVSSLQIQLWEWIASYYMCSLGEVYKNVFPSALKLESDTYVRIAGNSPHLSSMEISDEAYILWEALQQKKILSVDECSKIVDQATVLPLLKELLDYGLIILDEKLIEKYQPKVENYLRINSELSPAEIANLLEGLANAPKQRELFLKLYTLQKKDSAPIKVSVFLKDNGGTHAQLRSLEEKHLLEIYSTTTQRIQQYSEKLQKIKTLSEAQQYALDEILHQYRKHSNVLLHGVTSSGKTEIYIKLIEQTLEKKQRILYLLPEIALTTQLTQRIQKYFGNRVGVYHSKFNQNERVELWLKTLKGDYDIIIGARSALFLPLQNLGLIIIDEEHESSLKQNETKPFYHARDTATVWAKMNDAKVLMGSATPSLEMYHLALQKKIGYVELNQRYGNVQMPEMQIIDLKKAYKEKRITGNISHKLEEKIRETFKAHKQVIIFQNRRGYAPVLECNTCGHTPFCPNCDVTLTYHKLSNELKCHYCGHSQSTPVRCYNCGSTDLKTIGLGTEQLEDEFNALFPQHQIARMDVDSMRKKFAFEKLIEAFENHEIDLLVGTQMVTKGLDFEDVTLVGIIKADNLLNFPDFRAHERAFQRIVQVAGRAGRRNQRGQVLIQAFNAESPLLQNATLFDYKKTAHQILYDRKTHLYPPYTKLIEITFRHPKREKAEKTATYYTHFLRPFFNEKTLLGPEPPLIAKLNNQYRYKTLIKIKEGQNQQKIKRLLKEALNKLHSIAAFRSTRIDFDVNPY